MVWQRKCMKKEDCFQGLENRRMNIERGGNTVIKLTARFFLCAGNRLNPFVPAQECIWRMPRLSGGTARFSVNVIEQGSYPVTEEWLMIKNFRREILPEIMLTEKNKSGMIITC